MNLNIKTPIFIRTIVGELKKEGIVTFLHIYNPFKENKKDKN